MSDDLEAAAAAAAVEAIRSGDIASLKHLLADHPGLAKARIGPRTLLHVATDWPGHFPDGPGSVAVLIDAGADVNATFAGSHSETPLHWAASSDDVAVLDVLLDKGADIEATGAVIGGGTPLADAVAFGQWKAARRLVERGARTTLWQAAALGLVARVEALCAAEPAPDSHAVTNAFWCACHGGQRATAEYLHGCGAALNWVGHDDLTALDAAGRSGAHELVAWLSGLGAKSASDIG
jgi:ankyrin repeat protein